MRDGDPAQSMSGLRAWIDAEWEAWTGEPAPGDRLLLRGRKPGRVTIVVAGRGQRLPSVVVKATTAASGHESLGREFDTLATLRDLGASRHGISVPVPLGRCSLPGVTAIATSALPGRRIPPPNAEGRGLVARRVVRRYIRTVAALSRQLSTLGGQGPAPQQEMAAARIAEEFAARAEHDGTAVRARGFAAALRDAGSRWPCAWQHGDPAVGNLLVARRGAAYVDWESARPDCPPWLDVVTTPLALAQAAAAQRGTAVTADLVGEVLGDHRPYGRAIATQVEAVWAHEVPLAWAVVLGAMLASSREEQRGSGAAAAASALASALLADPSCRARVGWAAPVW